MSFLKFATTEVQGMARTLESSGARMKGASKQMQGCDASAIGHYQLQSACDEFTDSWDYGFGQLSKMTKGVSKFVNTAAKELTKTDEKLAKELKNAGHKGERK